MAGEWESSDRARAAWEEVAGRLGASPPIDYWRNRNAEVTLRLAAYARACVPDSERILNNLAMHFIDQGKLAAAEPLLRRTLELNPGRKIEYGNLALLYPFRQ